MSRRRDRTRRHRRRDRAQQRIEDLFWDDGRVPRRRRLPVQYKVRGGVDVVFEASEGDEDLVGAVEFTSQ